VKLNQPDWGEHSHAVAFGAELHKEKIVFHLILNVYWGPLDFELPPAVPGAPWRRWIDTSLPTPEDIVEWQSAPPVTGPSYRAGPRSVVMLYAEAGGGPGPSLLLWPMIESPKP
jgi:glycogen operon protein